MKNYFLIFVFLPVIGFGQVIDNFSDGDFTYNPDWYGDTGNFTVSSSSAVPESQRPALQLNAPFAGISVMSVNNHFTGDMEWHFWVKLSLNTSSGNFSRIYLLSDNSDLKGTLDGYFLQIGGLEDSAIFFRQDSLELIKLHCLTSVFTGNSVNVLRFKVLRSASGNWKFYADPAGGQSLEYQGETFDSHYPVGDYFGIYCQYTSSNLTKYYFDDFYAGQLIIDSIPPKLVKVSAAGPSEIILAFNEAIDPVGGENISNYEISPGLGHPYSAIRLLDFSIVHLFFDLELQSGFNYNLDISGIGDLTGNISGLISSPVMFYQLMPYDLVFTEVMADPAPAVGLPEYEYLEVLNRCPYDLDLSGWKLSVSSSVYEFPSSILGSGAYMLLSNTEAVTSFDPFSEIIAFPSFVLPNSSASVQLVDSAGNTVCYLQYNLTWYKDETKSDGGWSMEMIDTSNPCKN